MRRSNLFVVAVAAVLGCLVTLPRVSAQSATTYWEKAAGGKMEFSVASVKMLSTSDAGNNAPHSNFPLDNQEAYQPSGLLSANGYTLDTLIGFAYKLTDVQTQSVLSELPKWAHVTGFDIEARAQTTPTKDQMRLMMQSLLADRFKLKTHVESREGSEFALVLAKRNQLGPELKRHSADAPCIDASRPAEQNSAPQSSAATGARPVPFCGAVRVMVGPRGWRMGVRNITLGQFASYLPGPPKTTLDRPVVDRTGLSGTFDVVLEWEPDTPILLNGAPMPVAKSAEMFPEALKDQLGLNLKPTKGRINTLIIDHIEEPAPN